MTDPPAIFTAGDDCCAGNIAFQIYCLRRSYQLKSRSISYIHPWELTYFVAGCIGLADGDLPYCGGDEVN